MTDLFGFELPLWCLLSPLAVILLYWYGTSTHNTFVKMGIPYQKPLPFFGNLLSGFKTSVAERDKQNIERYPGGLFGSFQGLTPILECSDVDFIKDVTIKEFPKFMNRRNLLAFDSAKTNRFPMFSLQGEHWKHVRSTLSPSFTSGKLKLMYPVIKACSDKFVLHLKAAKAEPIVIKDFASGYTMEVIASTAFGMDIDVQSTTNHPFVEHAGTFFGIPRRSTWLTKFKQTITIILILALPQFLLRILSKFGLSITDRESIDYFYNIVKTVLSEQKSDTRQSRNFISMCEEKMVDLKDVDASSIRTSTTDEKWSTQGITEDEVLANATTFISAGYETTATTLQFFFYSMAVNPDIQEKLYNSISEVSANGDMSYEELQKLEYLDWCVSESLRLYPPAIRVDRLAKEDVTIRGVDLPKGQVINILVYAVHHNPLYWDSPEEFRPERFVPDNKTDVQQYAYLPFGAGGRSCIAMRLALLEVKVAVAKLITTFKFEKTAETPEPANLEFNGYTLFLQPIKPLKLSAVPR